MEITQVKTYRRRAARFTVAAIAVLVVGMFAAAVTYAAGILPALHDVASVVRMPIPGTADANLDRGDYGLYFGLLNAPKRRAIHLPRLNITIVPPNGIDDPEFVEVPSKVDEYVDGFNTVQVARISVRAPGRYHLHVESPDEFGGSFSIGEMPTVLDSGHALARAIPVALVTLALSALLTVAAVLFRGRAKPR